MKIYTRKGDDGTTGLLGGTRVQKHVLRVEAYGTVDELNAALGLAASGCSDEELGAILTTLRHELFELGAQLAAPADSNSPTRIGAPQVDALEKHIDRIWDQLTPLKYFILPGGSELSSRLHLARAISRRAERLVVALAQKETVDGGLVIYLNRLSDLLFAMARRANQLEGVQDVVWKG